MAAGNSSRCRGVAQMGPLFFSIFFLLLLAGSGAASSSPSSSSGEEKSGIPLLFVFGDSLWDTGNAALLGHEDALSSMKPPNGITFPGHPAGRLCDGRLLLDYLASYMGLPTPVPPFQLNASIADFSSSGVNYAVVGSTALDLSVFESLSLYVSDSFDGSLEDQVQWHLALKAEVEDAPNQTLPRKPSLSSFAEGLYIISIGGNDFMYAYNLNASTLNFAVDILAPIVIQSIHEAVETLYLNGARNFLLVGTRALGCAPKSLYLNLDAARDDYGCVQELNIIARYSSLLLHREVEIMRDKYTNATFIFGDATDAHLFIARNQETFGFVDTIDACCGGGYYYNAMISCGDASSTYCENPNASIFWDRVHNTDNFNRYLFQQIFETGSFLDPSDGLLTYIHATSNTM